MIPRPQYINELQKYKDAPLVKILSGVRRCGKSTILDMFREHLLSSGVPETQIIARRYSSFTIPDDFSARDMYQDIAASISGRCYVFLDEVQEVTDWEKTVNSLLEDFDVDLYVTGSNSKLMSSEISTYLTGRYVQIPVYPLSFQEYLSFRNDSGHSVREQLADYIRFGGFPVTALQHYDERTVYQIVEGIYTSVVNGDIARRHKIKDYDLFERTVKYVFENVGKTFSANSIIKFLKSEKRSVNSETIYNYLEWLEQAFIVYRCNRYDLQGKEVLQTLEKYYLADSAFKYCLLGFNTKSIASMMENIIYFELRRRGWDVYIGKNGTKEIDFVASRRDDRMYVQVTRNMPEDSTREEDNLQDIRDHYPKYIVTLDEFAGGNINGIKIMHMADFLLSDAY